MVSTDLLCDEQTAHFPNKLSKCYNGGGNLTLNAPLHTSKETCPKLESKIISCQHNWKGDTDGVKLQTRERWRETSQFI